MRVVYLTAGAAGMYCGSCLRDNTLVAALRATGRDALLVPLFTPIRTDEADVSEPCVLYGAINVYLQHKYALFRRLPRWADRLFDLPWLLRRVAKISGSESPEDLGSLTIATLQGEHGPQRKEVRRVIAWLRQHRPDLVNLPNAMFVHLARPIKDALGIPVICTLTGEDIFIDLLPSPQRERVVELIREQAAFVDGFVATSRYYAEHCHGWLDIPADRMQVIYPGVKADAPPKDATPKPSSSASADNPFVVGYMARVCPAKGLHLLYEAVGRLRNGGRNVVLVAAGNLNAGDRPYLDEMRLSPSPGFIYRGEVNRAGKQALLQDSHVLSVPTVHREAKGLFVLEALAQGVPVVQPRHGAFPELIEATGGGLLVEPNDPEALADGIARLIDQPDLREHLGRQGRAAVLQSFTDRTMAEQTWALYQRYCGSTHA